MEIGVIVELTPERHLGYIKQKGVKENIFFHEEALEGVRFAELKKGTKVSFKITKSLKGPYAAEVRKL